MNYGGIDTIASIALLSSELNQSSDPSGSEYSATLQHPIRVPPGQTLYASLEGFQFVNSFLNVQATPTESSTFYTILTLYDARGAHADIHVCLRTEIPDGYYLPTDLVDNSVTRNSTTKQFQQCTTICTGTHSELFVKYVDSNIPSSVCDSRMKLTYSKRSTYMFDLVYYLQNVENDSVVVNYDFPYLPVLKFDPISQKFFWKAPIPCTDNTLIDNIEYFPPCQTSHTPDCFVYGLRAMEIVITKENVNFLKRLGIYNELDTELYTTRSNNTQLVNGTSLKTILSEFTIDATEGYQTGMHIRKFVFEGGMSLSGTTTYKQSGSIWDAMEDYYEWDKVKLYHYEIAPGFNRDEIKLFSSFFPGMFQLDKYRDIIIELHDTNEGYLDSNTGFTSNSTILATFPIMAVYGEKQNYFALETQKWNKVIRNQMTRLLIKVRSSTGALNFSFPFDIKLKFGVRDNQDEHPHLVGGQLQDPVALAPAYGKKFAYFDHADISKRPRLG